MEEILLRIIYYSEILNNGLNWMILVAVIEGIVFIYLFSRNTDNKKRGIGNGW